MQSHIFSSVRAKNLVFCSFLQDFTHVYISKIFLKTTISGIELQVGRLFFVLLIS